MHVVSLWPDFLGVDNPEPPMPSQEVGKPFAVAGFPVVGLEVLFPLFPQDRAYEVPNILWSLDYPVYNAVKTAYGSQTLFWRLMAERPAL
jgi:hypothetical protein